MVHLSRAAIMNDAEARYGDAATPPGNDAYEILLPTLARLGQRQGLARLQTRILIAEEEVAEGYNKISHHKHVSAIMLAMGGRWEVSLPPDSFKIVLDFVKPILKWTHYPRLTWSLSDPLLPHDPLHSHRDDFPWRFQIPEDQERWHLDVRHHLLQTMEAELISLKAYLEVTISYWHARRDSLLVRFA